MSRAALFCAFTLGCSSVHLASVRALPAAPLCVADAAVFDGARLLQHQDVLLDGTRIGAVRAHTTELKGCIDGAGKTLLPGLIDMHAHLSSAGQVPWQVEIPDEPALLGAFLYAGVTTALIAQHASRTLGSARDVASGKLLGPRLYLAGPGLTAVGGHPVPMIRAIAPWPFSSLIAQGIPQAKSEDSGRARVREVADDFHPPFFKIFFDTIPDGSPRLTLAEMRAAVDEATKRHMRPIVHVGDAWEMVSAAEAGASLLMHCAYKDELDEAQAERIARTKVPFVTTLLALAAGNDKAAGRVLPIESETLEAGALLAFKHEPTSDSWTRGWVRRFADRAPSFREHIRANLRTLRAAGVEFFPGSDASAPGVVPGASLHVELQLLQDAGVPALELLERVTAKAAAFLEAQPDFGSIRPGLVADLLLVRGDPTVDVRALDAIDAVIVRGALLARTPVK